MYLGYNVFCLSGVLLDNMTNILRMLVYFKFTFCSTNTLSGGQEWRILCNTLFNRHVLKRACKIFKHKFSLITYVKVWIPHPIYTSIYIHPYITWYWEHIFLYFSMSLFPTCTIKRAQVHECFTSIQIMFWSSFLPGKPSSESTESWPMEGHFVCRVDQSFCFLNPSKNVWGFIDLSTLWRRK